MAFRLSARQLQRNLTAQTALKQSKRSALLATQISKRYATGTVSNQPASRNIKELKDNAKEEAKTVAKDIASTISGANERTSQLAGHSASEELSGDISATTALFRQVPRNAMLFGAAGALPYVGTSAATVYLSRQAALAMSPNNSTLDADTALALLHHVENLQLAYGALILSFIGSIHWGLEWAKFNGEKGTPRYLLGVVPVLVAMPTLSLTGAVGMSAQFAAFTGTWFMDRWATTAGWTPAWYSTYRFWLTLAVGSSLVLTMAGANYFGPGARLATTGRRLQEVNAKAEERYAGMADRTTGRIKEGEIGGDISAASGDEGFVLLTNEKKKKEEEEKAKAEEKKKAEEAAQKAKEDKEKQAQDAKDKAKAGPKTPGA